MVLHIVPIIGQLFFLDHVVAGLAQDHSSAHDPNGFSSLTALHRLMCEELGPPTLLGEEKVFGF